MSDTATPPADAPLPTFGGEVRVSLACPNCQTSGWVEWNRLRHGLRCAQCRRQFLLGRNGKLCSVADLPHTGYRCPRCGQSGSIPTMLAVRAAECGACRLPLVAGPDHRLHDVQEAAALRRAAQAQRGKSPWSTMFKDFAMTEDGRLRIFNLVVAALLLVGVFVGAAVAIQSLWDDSVGAAAREFTATCLSGDWDDAALLVVDDAVEQVEFARWRVRYFPSITDARRPAGDDVEISVDPVHEDARTCELRVTLRSPFLGERNHVQCWQRNADRWRFSAVDTLRATDGR